MSRTLKEIAEDDKMTNMQRAREVLSFSDVQEFIEVAQVYAILACADQLGAIAMSADDITRLGIRTTV